MTLLFVKKENPQKTMQNHNHFIFIILLTFINGVINISNDQLQVDKKLLIIPFPNFKKK